MVAYHFSVTGEPERAIFPGGNEMMELALFPTSPGAQAHDQLVEQLLADLAREVGPAKFSEGQPPPNAKSDALVSGAGIAVAILSAPAVLRLMDLLKAYLIRDRKLILRLQTDDGEFELDAANISTGELENISQKLIAAFQAPK
jgi:hypothetical protein